MKKLCIFGAGGMGRKALLVARRAGIEVAALLDIEERESIGDVPVEPEAFFDPRLHTALVALGDSRIRRRLVHELWRDFGDVEFVSAIDPEALFLDPNSIKVGPGSLICAHAILTQNVSVGPFALINLGAKLGHDVMAGKFLTTGFSVGVSGFCRLGDEVTLGVGCSIRDHIQIGDSITIGAGACVVTNLLKPGTYVGVPAKKMECWP